MVSTNNNELSNKSNKLLYVPKISSRNMRVLPESEGVMCHSLDGFPSGDVIYFLLEFACILRLDLYHSTREATIRVFKVGDVYTLSNLKELAHSF